MQRPTATTGYTVLCDMLAAAAGVRGRVHGKMTVCSSNLPAASGNGQVADGQILKGVHTVCQSVTATNGSRAEC